MDKVYIVYLSTTNREMIGVYTSHEKAENSAMKHADKLLRFQDLTEEELNDIEVQARDELHCCGQTQILDEFEFNYFIEEVELDK